MSGVSPDEPALRLTRAMVFAVVCLAVSVGGHALAGGGAVAPGIAALAFGGLLALAYLLSGRERGPEIVLGGTLTAQTLLHELFAWSMPGPDPGTAGAARAPGHGVDSRGQVRLPAYYR